MSDVEKKSETKQLKQHDMILLTESEEVIRLLPTKDSYENDFKRGLTEVGMELYYVIPNTDRYYGTIDKIDPLSCLLYTSRLCQIQLPLQCRRYLEGSYGNN